MLQLLNTLYRELSSRAGISPNQSHALAAAGLCPGFVWLPRWRHP